MHGVHDPIRRDRALGSHHRLGQHLATEYPAVRHLLAGAGEDIFVSTGTGIGKTKSIDELVKRSLLVGMHRLTVALDAEVTSAAGPSMRSPVERETALLLAESCSSSQQQQDERCGEPQSTAACEHLV